MTNEDGVNFEQAEAIDLLIGLGHVLHGIVVGGPDLLVRLDLSPAAIRRILDDCDRHTSPLRLARRS